MTGLAGIIMGMRADRLVATLLILQARGRVTAAELAEQLEISERTARRDLDALAAAGLPVYSQQGRGGGWSLLGGARTDLSGLTAAEARALFLVAGPSSSATPELRAALRKLVRALPETFRASAEAAASAVVVDPVTWGRSEPAPPPRYLDVLQQAVVEGVQVDLGYASRSSPPGERRVHPLGLATKGTVWYLVADTGAGLRTFRVSRVTSVTVTQEPVVRPPGFDLAVAWRSIVATVDERRTPAMVTALADREIVGILRVLFGARLSIGGPAPDGRIQIEMRGYTPERVAAEVAGLGNRLEITGPPEARSYLTEVAAQLRSLYC
jgi:predicted DNA-binding transcriptional regulator YafY